jgi:hypothetical protein
MEKANFGQVRHVVDKTTNHDSPIPMGPTKRQLKKNPLQDVRGKIHLRILLTFELDSSNSDKGKDNKNGQPPLPPIPPRWGRMPLN